MSESSIEITTYKSLVEFQDLQPLHCQKDALTDFFGWILQIVLAGIAFSCLIAKRFCEPPYRRRPWNIWWMDTSKQGIGALFIHMINVLISPIFKGDPCTWYIINFLLDSTIGLVIIYIGIRISIFLAKKNNIPAIEFDAPKSWISQTFIYLLLMMIVKLLTALIIQMDMWNDVKNLILSPFKNPKLEVIMVMLIIPFCVNILLFWVTDNFLMRNKKHFLGHHQLRQSSKRRRGHSILEKVKVKYQNSNSGGIENHRTLKKYESESELLSSEDDPIIQIQDTNATSTIRIQQRSNSIQS